VNGVAIDQDDVRAHGRDERVRIGAFYDGVEFFYLYLKELTSSSPVP
jgi:acetylornithine deacetylase/succinyl-diaminopimelate desuccinylase-like protein